MATEEGLMLWQLHGGPKWDEGSKKRCGHQRNGLWVLPLTQGFYAHLIYYSAKSVNFRRLVMLELL